MTSFTQISHPKSDQEASVWIRGLLTVAWADGDFDIEEKHLITKITKEELTPDLELNKIDLISPEELAATLGKDKAVAENFLRTAVMVAVADGVYSRPEADLLNSFCAALDLEVEALKSLEHTLYNRESEESGASVSITQDPQQDHPDHPHSDILKPVRDWLDGMEVDDPRVARFICKLVPSQCPFERDIRLFGHKLVHIPPLCKLNPLYEQLVGLRFRALSFLADECNEDVSKYT
ncbi:Mo-dependent nitrogenase family protein [Halothece sp. PCC 7418]|uniref:Mo-dependent nitrogenase C-terminal domain-containing protein n=1 Tax=Halothece sp. (strain PCC 7418) TaxID=65093 RepID=UPI0002A06727|nr:Mo-dependent nitrogenase C-terminal domain-containing protein [Halothece sp. PCC 7418]AFZ45819.1 Mo-dependent nitrogenase family protein [Halothece sp. PCC 7418]